MLVNKFILLLNMKYIFPVLIIEKYIRHPLLHVSDAAVRFIILLNNVHIVLYFKWS